MELDEDVAGLEIPVNDAHVVDTLHALGDREGEVDHHAVVEAELVYVLVQEVIQVALNKQHKRALWCGGDCQYSGKSDLAYIIERSDYAGRRVIIGKQGDDVGVEGEGPQGSDLVVESQHRLLGLLILVVCNR